MTTLSALEARKRLYNRVDEVKETHVPVQIVGKRSSAVCFRGGLEGNRRDSISCRC